MLKEKLILISLFLILYINNYSASELKQSVNIGILANRGIEKLLESWQPTIDHLNKVLPDYSIQLIPLDFYNIDSIISQEKVDFAFLNPAEYIRCEKLHDMNKLATIVYQRGYKKHSCFGGVIFVKASKPIFKIEDLRGKKIAAVNKRSFGGWIAPFATFLEHGINPYKDCEELCFLNTHDSVVLALKTNLCDAGIVRTETLERLYIEKIINLKDYRVLNQDLNYQAKLEFKMLLSTKLYPEWVFSSLKHTSYEIRKKILTELLKIDETSNAALVGNYTEFIPAVDYHSVKKLLSEIETSSSNNEKNTRTKNNSTSLFIPIFLLFAMGSTILLLIYILRKQNKNHTSFLKEQYNDSDILLNKKGYNILLDHVDYGVLFIDIKRQKIIFNKKFKELFFQNLSISDSKHDWKYLYETIFTDQTERSKILSLITAAKETKIESTINNTIYHIEHYPAHENVFFQFFSVIKKTINEEPTAMLSPINMDIEDKLNDIVWVLNTKLQFTFVSSSITKATGYTKEEYLSKQISEILTPESFKRIYPIVVNAVENFKITKTINLSFEHINKDGSISCFECNVFLYKTEPNEIASFIGVSKDITKEHKYSTLAKKYENEANSIFEFSPFGKMLLDSDLNIIKVNSSFCKMLKCNQADILGKNYTSLLPNETVNKYGYNLVKMVSGEIFFPNEFYFLDLNNNKCYVKTVAVTLKNYNYSTNEVFLHTIEDKTEEKRTEHSLKETNQQFKLVWENSFDGMRLTDNNGIILLVNKAYCAIVKKEAAELIGVHYSAIYTKEWATPLHFDQTKTTSNSSIEKEITLWNGEKIWLEMSYSFIQTNDNQQVLLSIFRDISKRKIIEEALNKYSRELETANKSKDRFFSIIAHELKNPFQSLLGLSDLLITDIKSLSIEETSTIAESINKSVNTVFNLLQNLLEWSRLQLNNIGCQPQELSLYYLSKEVILLLENVSKNKNITIVNELRKDDIVFADKNMINTVIQNLLTNAIKFSNFNSDIKISSKNFDNKIEISIIDKGIGINSSDIDKLFKVESNFSTVGTNKESGTGLGLILCKEMVEKNKGDIGVESTVNVGSRFYFSLPKPNIVKMEI